MIAILDACSGNLRSVERALAHVGGDVVVTRDPDVIRRADKIVVPGQGAFGVFMRGLAARGLGEALREAIAAGKPYLGICLGLQILFEHSDEGCIYRMNVHSINQQAPANHAVSVDDRRSDTRPEASEQHADRMNVHSINHDGDCNGLGVLAGRVTRLVPDDPRLKIPHMGWNRIAKQRAEPLLEGIDDATHFYFVHSYRAVPSDPSIVVAVAEHGVPLCVAIRSANLFACQFHPEKSQAVGLRLLRTFVEAS